MVAVHPGLVTCDNPSQEQRFILKPLEIALGGVNMALLLVVCQNFGDEAGGDFAQFEVLGDDAMNRSNADTSVGS